MPDLISFVLIGGEEPKNDVTGNSILMIIAIKNEFIKEDNSKSGKKYSAEFLMMVQRDYQTLEEARCVIFWFF